MFWDMLGYVFSRVLVLLVVYLALMLAILYSMSGEKETPQRLQEYVEEYDIRTFHI
jgi:hypothetical protein